MAHVYKHTQFDKRTLTNHPKTTTTNSKRQLPKTLTIDYILGKAKLLHPTIKNNLTMLGTHHIKLHMKVLNKANQKKRLIDGEEFIPCSVQTKFKFKVSKEAEADQEFVDPQEATKDIIE
eukprot:776079-Ditylum_brightwellii.AAC.1